MTMLAALAPETARFFQAVVEGLSLAAIYALLALGFVIIYKSTQVLSFAQPALLIFGAYMASYMSVTLGWGFWVGVGLGILFTATLGAASERLVLRPMLGKPVFAAAILTIGLDIAIRVVVGDLIGTNVRAVGTPVSEGFGAPALPWGSTPIRFGDDNGFGGVVLQPRVLALVITTAILVAGLLIFFRKSRMGLAMRATALDQEVAQAQGIDVGRVFSVAWILGGALAAVAGVFGATAFAGLTQSNFLVALKALPAIVVGGLDSIPGALVGALIIGLAEAFTSTYQSQYASWLGGNFSQVVPYVVMLIVLLVRPYGLFGTKEVERV
jgi:branched-chain amino acid transport system permease protein